MAARVRAALVGSRFSGLLLLLLSACGGQAAKSGRGVATHGGSGGVPDGASGVAGSPSSAGATQSSGGTAEQPAGGAATSLGGNETQPGGATSSGGAAVVTPEPPHPYRALQIVTGALHACALLEDHRVKCWGLNGYGQLGIGDTQSRGLLATEMGDALPFVELGAGRSAKALAAGRYTTCAILDDDSLKCWGLDLFIRQPSGDGQLGDRPGEMGDKLPRIPLGAAHTAKQVAIGWYDACVALDDDSYFCGGTSNAGTPVPAAQQGKLLRLFGAIGVLGLFDTDAQVRTISPSAGAPSGYVKKGVVALAGNDQLICFQLLDGSVDCGGGAYTDVMPASLPPVVDLAVSGSRLLCALNQQGDVQCWGYPLEDVPWAQASQHTLRVPLPRPAVEISGGNDFQCGLLNDGGVVCWDWSFDRAMPVVARTSGDFTKLERVDLGIARPE